MANKFLVIDVESGGLDPLKHSILTLGCVVWNDGAIDGSILIKIAEEQIVAEQSALDVNGIDIDELRTTGVNPYVAVTQLEQFLAKHDMRSRVQLVGHNLPFDVGFLKRLYTLTGRSYASKFSYRGLCTQSITIFLQAAKRLNIKGSSGDVVFGHFNVAPLRVNGKHDALGDATACAKVLTKYMDMVSLTGMRNEIAKSIPTEQANDPRTRASAIPS